MSERVCINCKISIFGKKKRFCSDKCRTRHNSLKDYYKIRDTPKYKEYKKDYFKKWLDKNRLHFNDLLREPNRIRVNKKRAFWKKEGLCSRCGKVFYNNNLKSCADCRIKARKLKNE